MSASVPVGVTSFCGATVTLILADRSTSPLAPDSILQPLASGLAVIPYPGTAVAFAFSRLMLTRTTLSAYGSTITVAAPRDTTIGCAHAVPHSTTSIAAAVPKAFMRILRISPAVDRLLARLALRLRGLAQAEQVCLARVASADHQTA